MTIILVGLNHRTAPVALREQLSLAGYTLQVAQERLHNYRQGLHESVILSTCNRLEIYAVVDKPMTGYSLVESLLMDIQDVAIDDLQKHLYYQEGNQAINHLMRVASGLDSMILGEPQILGQVTQAFQDAQSTGLTGSILSRLFSQAIHAGKRARTETEISRFTTSISYAGALKVLDHVDHPSPNVLVLGAGEMAVLAAKALQKHSITELVFINRTYSRAVELADELGGTALNWHQLPEALIQADAVITATGAPHIVIYAEDVERIQAQRNGRKLLFVDIAVPRDVEVSVGRLHEVQRFDIDDLQSVVDHHTVQREAAVPFVESIIEQEHNSFLEWYYSRQVTPVIQDLRKWANEVMQAEVEQALNKLGDADAHTIEVMNRMAHRIVNKLLHEPTVRLREQAVEGNGYGYAHAVSELFALRQNIPCETLQPNCEYSSGEADTPCNLQCITPATDVLQQV